MYYEYWGLKKPPFDNVPDPSMYVDCHPSMESALAESLFAIEEGNECLAVIIGDVGLGKTLSLRMIIDNLDQEKYKIALVTNPSISFTQLMQELIGQLTGSQCLEKRKAVLLERFNKIIFETMDEGKKVVLLIDEANAMPAASLENLRLLTNMQDDQRNLFTMVLAGQMELARRLEHPKRLNLFQRIGTYSRIDKIQSEDLVKAYVEKRIALAGGNGPVFSEDAFPFIWEHSAQGVPRLINKMCKLSLKAGETNGFDHVSGELVHQIGQRFASMTAPVAPKRKSRKKAEEKKPGLKQTEPPRAAAPEPVSREPEVEQAAAPLLVETGEPDVKTAPSPIQAADPFEPEIAGPVAEPDPRLEAETALPVEFVPEELEIGEVKINLNIHPDLIAEAKTGTEEFRVKLAGVLAAQALKKYPELTSSPAVDPVNIWSEIRGHVLKRFDLPRQQIAA
ncbi:MAG TPA: AAA family ATPase [Thermodesulfobacteriota bacterium]|nr:AAA family ATPase [Thermodesulfobacteriota bacterium]